MSGPTPPSGDGKLTEVPANANQHCPGTSSDQAGKSAACAGCPNQSVCATAPKGPDPDIALITERLSKVKHKLLVLSGKGGVGKSTVSAQLAFELARQGKEVGLLDIDICGPSVPKMLGLEGQEVHQSNLGWSPVYVEDNLAVMSIGFMLPDPDEAVIWRGPRKNGLIKQFLRDVHWGELDYLVVDAPPGTSDEHITISQCLQGGAPGDTSAIIVTTPQDVAVIDVRKEINFCKKVGLRVLGVVENMSGLVQSLERCKITVTPPPQQQQQQQDAANGAAGAGADLDVTERVRALLAELYPGAGVHVRTEVFHAGGGADRMCADMGVELLGRLPLDPQLGLAAERGQSVQGALAGEATDAAHGAGPAQSPCLPALLDIVSKVVAKTGGC